MSVVPHLQSCLRELPQVGNNSKSAILDLFEGHTIPQQDLSKAKRREHAE